MGQHLSYFIAGEGAPDRPGLAKEARGDNQEDPDWCVRHGGLEGAKGHVSFYRGTRVIYRGRELEK